MKRTMMTCAALFAACCVGCSSAQKCHGCTDCKAQGSCEGACGGACATEAKMDAKKEGHACPGCAAQANANGAGAQCPGCKAKQG